TGEVAGYNSAPGIAGYLYGDVSSVEKADYVVMPSLQVPQITERRFIRATDDKFPSAVDFTFGNTNSYGLRVENGPLDPQKYDVTVNTYGNNRVTGIAADTQADEFVLGYAILLLGDANAGPAPFRDGTFSLDPITHSSQNTYGNDAAYIQKFYDTGHS